MKIRTSIKGIILALLVAFPLVLCGCSNKTSSDNSSLSDSSRLASATPDNSFAMYEVTSKDNENVKLYLFGSIHVAPDDVYPLPEKVMNTFNKCTSLAVECDIVAAEEDFDKQLSIMDTMTYQGDSDNLYNHLDKDVADKIIKYLEDNGYGSLALTKFKPASIEQLCSAVLLSKTKLKTENGLDRFFLSNAKKDNKEILEVESYDFQLNMLYSFPDRYYDLALPSYYEQEAESIKQTNQLYQYLVKGDIDKLKATLKGDANEYNKLSDQDKAVVDSYNKAMSTDRDQGMVAKAEQYMKDGKNVFFVVGCAHIVEENGIVDTLISKGYKVKKI